MLNVDGKLIESISYNEATRLLYVKFHAPGGALCFEDIPKFRYNGLMNAPRKDAYFTTYIRNSFLSKPVTL